MKYVLNKNFLTLLVVLNFYSNVKHMVVIAVHYGGYREWNDFHYNNTLIFLTLSSSFLSGFYILNFLAVFFMIFNNLCSVKISENFS